jgi:hypothetical protein
MAVGIPDRRASSTASSAVAAASSVSPAPNSEALTPYARQIAAIPGNPSALAASAARQNAQTASA